MAKFPVDALVRAARGPAAANELAGRAAAVDALVRGGAGATSPVRSGRTSMIGKLLGVKTLAVAVPGLLLTGGVAAAATGSLPGPAQSAASHVLSDVGISVPNGHGGHSGTGTSGASSSQGSANGHAANATGPDATGPAAYGLCTAFKAGGLNQHSVAYRNLAKAAGGASNIDTYCASVSKPTTTTTQGNGTGDDTSSDVTSTTTAGPGNRDHAPVSTPPTQGPPSSTPPVSAPPVSTPDSGADSSGTGPGGHAPSSTPGEGAH